MPQGKASLGGNPTAILTSGGKGSFSLQCLQGSGRPINEGEALWAGKTGRFRPPLGQELLLPTTHGPTHGPAGWGAGPPRSSDV